MKKIIIAFLSLLLFVPLFASASFDTNLYYGLKANADVKVLQTFLVGKGFLTGDATGNFFSLTFRGVRLYQTSVGITPTGFVGPITRKSINDELAKKITPLAPKLDASAGLQSQIAQLQGQLNTLNAQQSQIAQNVQQIQNNQPAPQNPAPVQTPAPTSNPTPTPSPTPAAVFSATVNVSTNSNYPSQVTTPGQTGAKIGSFVIKNDVSSSESIKITQLKIDLVFGSRTSLNNFSALRTSVTSGNGAVGIQTQNSNSFTISETLAPAQMETIDIFANVSTDHGNNVNVQTILTPTYVGVNSGVSNVGNAVTGQTISFNQ